MKIVADVFIRFRTELTGLYDIKEINAITMLVLGYLLQTSNAKLKAFPEIKISPVLQDHLEIILTELKTGKPVQYILGHTEFYGLTFKVNPSVLIPRPETEELVQWVIESVKNLNKPGIAVLDIGTGSGCIPITLGRYLADNKFFAIDISSGALEIAMENATLNKVNVKFIEADILKPMVEIKLPKFDMITSNPPYVTMSDKKLMHTNVVDFEPQIALFVAENDPLIFYNAITDFAKKQLTANGMLFFEINENYGQEMIELLHCKGFKAIELKQDLSGRDRMIKATLA